MPHFVVGEEGIPVESRTVGYFPTIVGRDNLNIVLVLSEYIMEEKNYNYWMGFLNIDADLGNKLQKSNVFDKCLLVGHIVALVDTVSELNIITRKGTKWIRIYSDPLQDDTAIPLCDRRNTILDKCIVINDIIKLQDISE